MSVTNAPPQQSSSKYSFSPITRILCPSSSSSTSTPKTFFLPSVLVLKLEAMIKLWPSTPIEQTTPRAGPNGQLLEPENPFDVSHNANAGSRSGHHTPTAASYHHHLLNTHSPFTPSLSSATALTPPNPISPIPGTLPPALPTTHLSLHAPDFNMQQPPSSTKVHPMTANLPPPSQNNPSDAPNSSKGQIHIKLIQARSLCVRTMHARPYVVVQFEQSEFVSRDPTNETDKEVKGIATNLSRNGSSNALSALGAIGSKVVSDNVKRAKNSTHSTPSSSFSSGKSTQAADPPKHTTTTSHSTKSLFGRPSAHNPVWKHEVSL